MRGSVRRPGYPLGMLSLQKTSSRGSAARLSLDVLVAGELVPGRGRLAGRARLLYAGRTGALVLRALLRAARERRWRRDAGAKRGSAEPRVSTRPTKVDASIVGVSERRGVRRGRPPPRPGARRTSGRRRARPGAPGPSRRGWRRASAARAQPSRSWRSAASARVPRSEIGASSGKTSSNSETARAASPLPTTCSNGSPSSSHGDCTATGRPCSVTTIRSPRVARSTYRLRLRLRSRSG